MDQNESPHGRYRFDLSGRTALITGASSGVGKHLALILASSGARVVIGARRVQMLDEVRRSIEERGGEALVVSLDVSEETSVIDAFDAAERRFGPVDTVIANAGVNSPASALKMPVEDFDALLNVNLRGVFITAREGARRMVAAGSANTGRGRIVLISSVTAERPYSGISAYSASKAAVVQFGRVIAKDWAQKGINVNTLCPGFMETELTDELWQGEFGRQLMAAFPRRRTMSLSALDVPLLYLCSDASAEVTGSVFTIDDGQTLA